MARGELDGGGFTYMPVGVVVHERVFKKDRTISRVCSTVGSVRVKRSGSRAGIARMIENCMGMEHFRTATRSWSVGEKQGFPFPLIGILLEAPRCTLEAEVCSNLCYIVSCA